MDEEDKLEVWERAYKSLPLWKRYLVLIGIILTVITILVLPFLMVGGWAFFFWIALVVLWYIDTTIRKS